MGERKVFLQKVEVAIEVDSIRCADCGREAPPPDVMVLARAQLAPLDVRAQLAPRLTEDPMREKRAISVGLGRVLGMPVLDSSLEGWLALYAAGSRPPNTSIEVKHLCPDCTPASVRKAVSKDE